MHRAIARIARSLHCASWPTRLALGLLPVVAGAAEPYPSRPIRMVVPFAPGGGSDIVARLVSPRLTELLGQQVVVDNRPGGNTVIGVNIVASARPDGHTLLLGNANFTINAALFAKLPYDPVRDFVAIAPLANVANVLTVHATLPAKTLQELIALARSKPGQFNFASPGSGTSSHMAGVLLQSMAKIEFTMVTYKGAGPAITDHIAGQIPLSVAAMTSVLPHVKSGRLRALGVSTARRSTLMPELPTIAEAGLPGYEVSNWFGILSASGTPAAVVRILTDALRRTVDDDDMRRRMTAQGTEPVGMTPEAFAQFIKAETAKWDRLGTEFKLRVE